MIKKQVSLIFTYSSTDSWRLSTCVSDWLIFYCVNLIIYRKRNENDKNTIFMMKTNKKMPIGQSLWILLDNNRNNIRIGVTYAPQENVTSNNELKLVHNNISKQILIAHEEKQQVLILGDFNAKVGAHTQKVTNQQR